jgi:alpha-L-fucosidase
MNSKDHQTIQGADWFRKAAFGMFVHWGLYAIPAGIWKGRETPVEGEWLMRTMRIPLAEYEQLSGRFNPVDFDAADLVRIAKDAGMKYIVITAKHHDGFAMFHSRYDKYNIVAATPFKRDPLAELATACSAADIKLGFYYSQDQDWHEPGGSGNDWDFVRKNSAVESIAGDLKWPLTWRVFAPLAKGDALLSNEVLRSFPDKLSVSGKTVKGQDFDFAEGCFDFDQVLGSIPASGRAGRTAYAFAQLTVSADSVVTIGAGADWWMQWWLDGEPVMDTLRSGNGHNLVALDNHVFNLKLSAGEHILAVRFISGSSGARFAVGGPRELRAVNWTPVQGIDPTIEFPQYLAGKVKTQLRELLTNYGPVAIIWFDTPYTITPEQSLELKDYVHSLQPDCLVSGRVGNGMGDYECLGDNELPAGILAGTWEGLGTTNQSWGYKANDSEWKSPAQLIKILAEHAAKNANYLLNVGPDANGVIPAPAVNTLGSIGAWLKVNGEAIYGAQALRFLPRISWGYVTCKDNLLYLIVLEEYKSETLTFFGLRNKVTAVYALAEREKTLPFAESHQDDTDYHKLAITLPQHLQHSALPYVIAVNLASALDVNPNAYSVRGTRP